MSLYNSAFTYFLEQVSLFVCRPLTETNNNQRAGLFSLASARWTPRERERERSYPRGGGLLCIIHMRRRRRRTCYNVVVLCCGPPCLCRRTGQLLNFFHSFSHLTCQTKLAKTNQTFRGENPSLAEVIPSGKHCHFK